MRAIMIAKINLINACRGIEHKGTAFSSTDSTSLLKNFSGLSKAKMSENLKK